MASMAAQRFEQAVASHTGLVRTINQDFLKTSPELGIALLADGMGGHSGGEVASRVAVEAAFADLVETQNDTASDELHCQLCIGQAVEAANRALFETVLVHPDLRGMGTTLVAAIFREGRVFYAHVGDSRLYRIRLGRLRRLTRDHSLIQQMLDDGVFANKVAAREAGVRDNILTRSRGMQEQTEVELGGRPVEAGDTFLLCSDGLHGCVSDAEIARILRDPAGDLDQQAAALINAALAHGGPDNVSVVLVRPAV
jgi:PPM family protein phosphatase